MITFPNRATINLPGDQVICDSLLPSVVAAVNGRTGASVDVALPGATRGAEVLVMRATADAFDVYPAIVVVAGQRRCRFGDGSPVYPDPVIPEDADPVVDAALAEAIAPAIATKLTAMLVGSALYVLHTCIDGEGNVATAGAVKALLTAGRKAGFNSSVYFPESGAPRLRFSR